jgi:hypothetical protein
MASRLSRELRGVGTCSVRDQKKKGLQSVSSGTGMSAWSLLLLLARTQLYASAAAD